jgi:hypothetical protein
MEKSDAIHLFYRQGVLALICICSFYLKYIFEIFENFRKMHVDLHIMLTKSFHKKNDILFSMCKKKKKSMLKMKVFHETMRTHIEYEDYICEYFSQICKTFEIYFLDTGSICSLDQKCISVIHFTTVLCICERFYML